MRAPDLSYIQRVSSRERVKDVLFVDRGSLPEEIEFGGKKGREREIFTRNGVSQVNGREMVVHLSGIKVILLLSGRPVVWTLA